MSALDLSGRPLAATDRDQELFVDRDEELDRAQAAIRRRSNVLVVGERGIGKTSFLHRLEQQASDGIDPIYVDASVVDDLPGLVELVAGVIAAHGGNWLESRMSHLGGKFAGILRAELPPDKVQSALAALPAMRPAAGRPDQAPRRQRWDSP